MNEERIASTNATVANALAAERGIAANSLYKKGDKVESKMNGSRGVIEEVYGDEWYAVRYEGERFPTKIQGWKLFPLPKSVVVRNARVVDKQIGGVRVVKWSTGDIGCELSFRGDELASPYGNKDKVVSMTKKCIASLKAKAADLEKALAFLQTL